MTGNSAPFIWKEISNSPINSFTAPCFQKIRLKMFFPLSTTKKFHTEIVFVAWLRDLSWEIKIVYLFFTRKNFNKIFNLSVALFSCFLPANIVYIYYYFRWLSWPFLRARPSQFIYSALSSFFAWCRACGSGTKDICTLQHGFPCFPLFLCIFIIFLALSHMYIILIPSARSLRFGSRLWKVNIDQNWNPFLSLFVSENPRHLWLYFSRKCVFICYLFPLEHETRSW